MTSIPTQLSHCSIRSWELRDEASLVDNANNRRIWLNLLDTFPHPYTSRDARAWIAACVTADPEVNFAIEFDGNAVGAIGLMLQPGVLSKTGSVGYWIGEPFWRRGIATAVVGAFAPWAMAAHELVRLEARVFSWNEPSMRVLEKCGFRREAVLEKRIQKDGIVLDEIVYARTAEALASNAQHHRGQGT
ncbi:MAG: GNAT family protein [Burkholderiales bacterium]